MEEFDWMNNKIVSALQRKILNYKSIDCAADDAVFISGSGRSGTSWLANICNSQNSFRYIFEPFNPDYFEVSERREWCLSRDMDSIYLRNVLEGRVSNPWVNSRNKKFFASRRLIKEIRSNFMLDWISHHYPKTKIILLLRNPLSICASRKKLELLGGEGRWVWLPALSELLADSCIASKLTHEQSIALSLQVGKGVEMESIAEWCLYNLVACNSDLMKKIHVVYYEDLRLNGVNEASKIMNYIDVEVKNDIADVLVHPSETTRSKIGSSELPLRNEWEGVLSNEVIQEAQHLLNLFNVSRLYQSNWSPVTRDQAG